MDITPNLALPYILASQAQKHVTHNEAIRALDALVQISVADRDLTAPPGSPAEGDRYIVATSATGAWSGHDGEIAAWQDAAWMFYAPAEGWIAWVADENALLAFDGAAWVTAALQNVPMLGVNATADATNRLALASAASLFNHAGAGHQQKINKATAGDTASQLYQSNLSGRAELGLAGDDDFHIKVSADGSAWHEAVVIDKDTGNVGIGTSAPTSKATVSANAANPQAALAGAIAHFVGADTALARVLQDGHGGAVEWIFRRSDGTAASPSAISGIKTLGGFGAVGYGSTGYSGGTRAYAEFRSGAAWTDADQSTTIHLYTTPVGSTTIAERLRILPNGDIRIGADGAAVCKLDVDGPARVKGYTVATVPAASAGAGQIIYVSDEAGGAALAFSDGTDWRRVTDRATIS